MPAPLEAAYHAAIAARDVVGDAPELDVLAGELRELGELVNAAALDSARYRMKSAEESLDEAGKLLSELLGRGAGRRDL